jgi:NAD(P)-dependent dehydrogenase (short-subunit alcohol dehydrogenase family)
MSEKTILVTGATDGIGKATIEELARRGMHVILHGRNVERVNLTLAEIQRIVPGARIDAAIADFASLEQVRTLANGIANHYDRLDVLINNAGVFPKKHELSADGFELAFAVNHLAHFLLTCELLPLLRASQARVVTVSSYSHRRGKIDFNDLNLERNFDGYDAYARSKLANILFSNELAECEQGCLTSNSLHPGGVTTKLLKTGFGITGISPARGAETSIYVALSPEIANVTGAYFSNCRITPTMPPVLDAAMQKQLWKVSERLVA